VDTSFSMVMEGRWLPMKRTALALNQLISTRFRSDELHLIEFGRHARDTTVAELTGLEPRHGAGHQPAPRAAAGASGICKHPSMQPVVLVVTDGEPTAHLTPTGRSSSTIRRTR
jgi:uncharacterized protein with von Willebrand factor type A (vWA) domain